MNFFVVYIESGRYLPIKKEWIENPSCGQRSKIFSSPHADAEPDFDCGNILHYFNPKTDACYSAFVVKGFGNY